MGLSIEELVRLSQGMDLELDKIIDSKDFDRIQTSQPKPKPGPVIIPKPEPVKPIIPIEEDDDDDDDKIVQQTNIISSDQARNIALSVVNGTITDFDFDDDDLEYEVEIEVGELEYEITIDARTGEVLEVEIDD